MLFFRSGDQEIVKLKLATRAGRILLVSLIQLPYVGNVSILQLT